MCYATISRLPAELSLLTFFQNAPIPISFLAYLARQHTSSFASSFTFQPLNGALSSTSFGQTPFKQTFSAQTNGCSRSGSFCGNCIWIAMMRWVLLPKRQQRSNSTRTRWMYLASVVLKPAEAALISCDEWWISCPSKMYMSKLQWFARKVETAETALLVSWASTALTILSISKLKW